MTVIILRRLVGPATILVQMIGCPQQGAAIVVVLFDQFVEPLSDRDTGSPRGLVGRRYGFRAKASEIPRTAGFHQAQNHFGRNVDRPGFLRSPLDSKAEGAVFCPPPTFPELL
jgi:hypothetical protein